MKLPLSPFTPVHWSNVSVEIHLGEAGEASWRTVTLGDMRIRLVEYSPGYVADHWCERGHILYVLEGELETELADGRRFTLAAGDGYQVSDGGDTPHRSSTVVGAKLFIVD